MPSDLCTRSCSVHHRQSQGCLRYRALLCRACTASWETAEALVGRRTAQPLAAWHGAASKHHTSHSNSLLQGSMVLGLPDDQCTSRQRFRPQQPASWLHQSDTHQKQTLEGPSPLGSVVLGSRSSSKKGCVNAPRAVVRDTGLYCSSLLTYMSPESSTVSCSRLVQHSQAATVCCVHGTSSDLLAAKTSRLTAVRSCPLGASWRPAGIGP